MITPYFNVTQDEEFIYIDVKVSHVRFSAASIEMVVENEVFIFSMTPYYLRLRFPYECVDDERAGATFDSPSSSVKIRIPKQVKGQFFPDLDLATKLLSRKAELDSSELKVAGEVEAAPDKTGGSGARKTPLIQELDVDPTEITRETAAKDLAEGEHFDWEIPQQQTQESISGIKYGFNNQYDKIVGVSMSSGNDINELGDPEGTAETDRTIERLIKENIKFDPEYYAADYIMEKYPSPDDDKQIGQLIAWTNPVTKRFLKWYKSSSQSENSQPIMPVEFTTKEKEQLIALPRKTYLVEGDIKRQSLLLVVNLLFAYHFDLRETEGDHNIESAWTIGKLTPQFAFLDAQVAVAGPENTDSGLRAAVIAGIRRALSYPLHRNYSMVAKVWDDVYYTLRGGKRLVLQCLLDLKELFRFHDVYYVYDQIWLQDLCAWLTGDDVSEAVVRNLAHDVRKEYKGLSRGDITFEKLDEDKMKDDDEEGDIEDEIVNGGDEMVALGLDEIEQMAEESFRAYQQN